ncbi:LuxR family transcriptional regulator [Rhodococcoides trifolii]|uniref:LuxR family transcriptional regulator n=1 Tax=Rhodococcoides trifolii TaxID=908250 RepID=A0A917CXM3_9NOCA|nr:LuxR family transcriptional regulator [Rhodococcus trifolii]GGG01538.1 LuxR family transcriptional regulator [Rhodococcus trifolii]
MDPLPRGEVPLVGRENELARILESADRFGGIAVKGVPGVGRTRLLTEATARLGRLGWTVMRIVTSAPDDGGTGLKVGMRTEATLTHVLDSVRAGHRTLVVVDDSHWIDVASTDSLARLVSAPNFYVLLGVSSGRRRTPVIDSLWKDGLLDRIDLSLLGDDDCARIVTRIVADSGDTVDAAAVHQFTRMARGNLVVLRELIAAAVDQGTLVRRGDLWRLTGELPVSPGIDDIVWAYLEEFIALSQLDGSTPAHRRHIITALQYVALADSLLLSAASALIDDSLLEELDTGGIVVVTTVDGVDRVEFATPVTGPVIRANLGQLRRRRLSASLAVALEAAAAQGHSGPREVVLAALLRLDGGLRLDAASAVTAARLSWRFYPPDIPRRLAEAADDAGGGFEAQLILATAEGQLGLVDDAHARLMRLTDSAATDFQRVAAVTACADNLVLRIGDGKQALALSYATELTLTDDDVRTQLIARRGLTMHAIGDSAGALSLLEPLLDDLSGPTLISACFAAATGATVIGKLSSAYAALDRVPLSDDLTVGPLHSMIDLCRCFTFGFAGDLSGAQDLALRRYREGIEMSSPLQQAWFSWANGGLLITRGLAAEAAGWLRTAHSLAGELGQGSMVHMVACDLVRCLAIAGRTADADELVAAADLDDAASPTLFGAGGTRHIALGWLAAVKGDMTSAERSLRAGADAHAGNEHHLATLHAYADLARCGYAEDVLPMVERLWSLVEGELATVLLQVVRALASTSGTESLSAATEAEKIGLWLHAAELCMHAARMFDADGAPRDGAAARRRANLLARQCGSPTTPLLRTGGGLTLSSREKEVARLAADGSSNKQIADVMVLSPRTVETHLSKVFAKLGIGTRAELAALPDQLFDDSDR